jgi:hypothetical protein
MSNIINVRSLLIAAALVSSMGIGYAFAAKQPHMEAALKLLEQARDELNQAVSNKGGNRGDAIQFINKAIAEVKEGIAFAEQEKEPEATEQQTQ